MPRELKRDEGLPLGFSNSGRACIEIQEQLEIFKI